MLMQSCAKCHVELTCIKNNVALVHFIDNDESKGVDAIRYGDLYKCPRCGASVVLGLGRQIGLETRQNDLERMIRFAREDGRFIEIRR